MCGHGKMAALGGAETSALFRKAVSLLVKNGAGFPGGSVVKNSPALAGDRVPSPVLEDPTCLGATKPLRHSC